MATFSTSCATSHRSLMNKSKSDLCHLLRTEREFLAKQIEAREKAEAEVAELRKYISDALDCREKTKAAHEAEISRMHAEIDELSQRIFDIETDRIIDSASSMEG